MTTNTLTDSPNPSSPPPPSSPTTPEPSSQPSPLPSPVQPPAPFQANPARAANLRDGGPKDASAVILRKYEMMWNAYQKRQSANHLVTTCGVHWSTATRAVKEGWPRYNLPPLRERWLALRGKAHDIADYDAARAMADALKQTQELDVTLDRIVSSFRSAVLDLRVAELTKMKGPALVAFLTRLYALVEQSYSLKMKALGENAPSQQQPQVQAVILLERIRTMTDAQLDAIIQRGGLSELLLPGQGKIIEADAEVAPVEQVEATGESQDEETDPDDTGDDDTPAL